MTVKEKILQLSEEILEAILAFKQEHPDFTCSLRSRDSVQSDEIRLGNGQWFQGSDYIYVPLFKKGDSARKIKTIGFVIVFNEDASIKSNYLEISFKNGSNNIEQAFHKDLAKKLNIELNDQNFGTTSYNNPNDYLHNLKDYLNRVRPIALNLLEQHGLYQKYVVSESEFQKRIKKINEIKKALEFGPDHINKEPMDEIIKLLKHKKQIILQGPPGTGKTYTAKKIAEQLVGKKQIALNSELTPSQIKATIKVGQKLDSPSDKKNYYTVNSINDDSVELQSENSRPWSPKYLNIIAKYKDLVNGKKPNNVNSLDPYEIAVAKYMFENMKSASVKNKTSYKLVQFHPSYSYEDFVRGIVAKSEGDKITYTAENNTFALLAEEANNNLMASKKDIEDFSSEEKIKELLIAFSENVQETIDDKGEYKITESVSIVDVEDDAFRYTGKWKSSQRMKFKDLVTAVMENVSSRQDFKKLENVSGLARQHATYFYKILEQFKKQFDTQLKSSSGKKLITPQLNNYVLIIDEINRANLPSVLGELIYALEYRGKPVNSIYAVDGDTTITIPENLYIIGTMNTADRSVGHIDYAIKRRFAFVDMLPDPEVIANDKAKALFNLVSELFTEKYLAPDFNAKDVHLGHSYFLFDDKSELSESEQLQLKLDYEILPILKEYVKDGLLLETAKEKIQDISKFEC